MHKDIIEKVIAESLEEKIQTIYNQHLNVFKEDDNLSIAIRKLLNRSKEFKSPSFLMLVVGPVKSGKSTLVNLIANFYVSPTDFLECTVRPSLISATNDNQELSVYRYNEIEGSEEEISETEVLKRKDEKIELIFDHVKGLIGESEIANVNKESFILNEENLRRYVSSELVTTTSDSILLTSIKTKGGILLKNNVYIIDMAGFDGARSNLDNAGYRKIAERADLIVFVQSSNSAISKVSTDFFKLIKENNSRVPVCLIQNVFKSAYWRSNEKIISDMEEQRKYAIEKIKDYGLTIKDEYAFNLNLGQVTDFRANNFLPQFKEEMSEESKRFDEIQQAMYELIIQDRESIRINNCINRTIIAKNELVKVINNVLTERLKKLSLYDNVEKDFLKLENQELNLSIDISALLNQYRDTFISEFIRIFDKKENESIPTFCSRTYKTSEAREIVKSLLSDIVLYCQTMFQTILQNIYKLKESETFKQWIFEINKTFLQNGLQFVDFNIDDILSVDAPDLPSPILNVDAIIKPKLFGLRNHTTKDMRNYFGEARELIIKQEDGGFSSPYLNNYIFPILQEVLTNISKNYCMSLKNHVKEIIVRNKCLVLDQIIADKASYLKTNESLMQMRDKFLNLNVVQQ